MRAVAALVLVVLVAGCGDGADGDPGGGAGSGGMGGIADASTDGFTAGSGGSAGIGTAGMAGVAGSAGAATGGSAGAAGAPNSCPRAKVNVAAGADLNVRPTPSTSQAPVGALPDGAIVDVLAQVQGQAINGNTLWFQIPAPAGYISNAYAACTLEVPPPPPAGYYLPLQCGKSAKISQGNFGNFSHQGNSAYAFDFSIGVGTPMVAMAAGTVAYTFDKTGPGDPCYNGGNSSCFPYANYVVLRHGDGKLTTYKHLSKVNVKVGQVVARGKVLGLSGSTGYSTGPHAHVMRMDDCGQYQCQSISLKFQDVAGDKVPDTGETVTSGNCP